MDKTQRISDCLDSKLSVTSDNNEVGNSLTIEESL